MDASYKDIKYADVNPPISTNLPDLELFFHRITS